ncbi:cystathionine gamma-lyase [Micrococcus flavus]|nr:cystathionine gamma-lyase [Micrococcus flavus]
MGRMTPPEPTTPPPAVPAFAPVLHHRTEHLTPGEPIAAPMVSASTFAVPGDPTTSGAAYQYARWDQPTWTVLEQSLAALEGAPTLAFPSGMGAIAAVLMPLLSAGDRVLLPSDGYGAVRQLADAFLTPRGVQVEYVPTSEVAFRDLAGVRLVHLETPSNPGLRVCDVAAVAERAHAAGALVVVDNTTLTALGQRPLELGADVVVSSDTKAVNGHSDALGGHVSTRDEAVLERVRQWRTLVGGIPGAHEAWLIHRGLETLEVRLSRMCTSAQALAELFASHPAVESVAYPGLPDHPDRDVVAHQMRLGGPLVAVTFADEATAERFIADMRWMVPATSFGGTHTSAERRARWGDDVTPGFVRVAVGCEPTEELLTEARRVLDALAA